MSEVEIWGCTNGRTNGRTDGRTDERKDQDIEALVRELGLKNSNTQINLIVVNFFTEKILTPK